MPDVDRRKEVMAPRDLFAGCGTDAGSTVSSPGNGEGSSLGWESGSSEHMARSSRIAKKFKLHSWRELFKKGFAGLERSPDR
jgi:hypothetical protein